MATITSNKKKYGQPVITAATGNTETQKQPVITAAQSNQSIIKLPNHAKQYNLNGTKKIPITVSITNNNILNTGAKNITSQTLKDNISNTTKSVALNQNQKQIDLSGKSTIGTTPVTKESIENKKYYTEPVPEKTMGATLANSAKLLLKGNLKPFESAADSIISGTLGAPSLGSYLMAGNSIGDYIEDTFGGKDEVKYTYDEKIAMGKRNSLNEQNKINKGLQMIGRYDLMRNNVNITDKDKLNLASANLKTLQGADESKEKWKNFKKSVNKNIAKDTTGEFAENIYTKAFGDNLSERSYIEDDSFGGKAINTIGQGFSQFLMSYAAGSLGNANSSKLAKRALEMTPVAISGYGGGLEEAYNITDDEKTAQIYALGSSTIEVLTELITGSIPGLGENSGVDYVADKFIDKIPNRAARELTRMGYRINGEGFEEGLANILGTYLKKGTIDPNAKLDWNSVMEDYMMGAISAGTIELPTNIFNTRVAIREQNIKKQLKESITTENAETKANELIEKGYNEDTALELVNEALKETKQNEVQYVEQQTPQNNTPNIPILNETQQDNTINQNQQNSSEKLSKKEIKTIAEEVNNQQEKKLTQTVDMPKSESKINAPISNSFINSAKQNNFNSESEEIKSVNRILSKKGIEGKFDSTPFKNSSEAAMWTIDENGKRSVIFNPKADEKTIFQNVAVHELTHDLLSSKKSAEVLDKQDILEYVSKTPGYDIARKSLEEAYSRRYDRNSAQFKQLVDEEVVASVLGSKLGNQEFINRLNGQKPNLAKRIYNWVLNKIDTLNKIVGHQNEKAYWRDVANRFEKAFNTKNDSKTIKKGTKYMMTSLKGMNNGIENSNRYLDIKNKFEKAVELEKSGKYTNEQIRQKTGWFKDNKGNWEFEISDHNVKFKIKPQENKIYKLGNLLSAKALYDMYPKLRDVNVKFKDMKGKGVFSLNQNTILVNNKLLDDLETVKGTLLHEIQHYIQSVEGLPFGTTIKFGNEQYANSKGEIEAADTKNRMNLTVEQRKEIIPESSKENPVHPNREKILNHKRNTIEKIAEKLYNKFGDKANEIFEEGAVEDNRETSKTLAETLVKNSRIKELDNSSFSIEKDSQGRTLSKEQQEYFKNSKVRDENGNLKVMYHGTPNDFTIFDTKKFGGANGTAEGFGIYLTDNIEVADDYLQNDKGNIMNLYANITKPATTNELTVSKQDVIKAIKELTNKDAQEMVADGDYDNIQDALKDTWISNYTYTYDKSIEQSYNDVAATVLKNSENDYEVLQELMNGSGNNTYKDASSFYDTITKTLGFDGIQTIWNFEDSELKQKNANILIAFNSNQVKNIDNTNPTTNDDIRFSKNNKNWNEFVDKNFKSEGTKTTFGELKIPISEELKKKVIRDKVKSKKNNNGLKSARTAAKIAKNKMDLSNNEKNEFRKELMKYKGYTKEKLTNAKTYNEIKDIVKKYSDREISYINREIQDVKDYIKNTKLEVTQELKNSITDYNDFRKSNFGKLKLSNEGMSIDSLYEELSQTYPGYFSNEVDTDEDRLYAIADFMNEDSTITEKYSLDDKTIDDITAKVFNTLQNNAFSEEQIEEFKKEISDRMSKITRKSVREMLQKQMGITAEDLSIGKDINSLNYQMTDPIRVNEKVFGRELGDKINNETIRKTTHNEARKVRWLNSERNDIKELGIKPRSKESAAVQKYGEKQYLNDNGELVKYGDKELRAEFPNEKTQEKIKRAAEVIRNKYDKYIDQINETLTSLGYDAIPKRADYMRHFQELGDIFSKTGVPFNLNDMRAEDLPTDINGLTEFNRPGKNYFASAQKRMGQKTTYDAITGIDGYLEGAGNLIYHTADIQRYRALSSLIRDSFGSSKGFDNLGDLTDAQAEQRVNDILDNKLSRYAAWLDEQANNLAGKKGAIDRGVERFLGRKVYTGLNTIKKQVGSNMTGFNVRSALTNLISSTIASAKTNKLAFVKGTASTIRNMFKNDGFIDKSDFLTTRFGSDQLSKKIWQKASNAGQIFMTGTDYFTANQITRSKYYEGLQKGLSESEAIKYADDFASRVMGDRSLGRTAEAFNSKTLGLLTQFQLEVNNQWQYMIHDTVMDYQKNSQINGGLKAGATALFQMGQLAAFSYFFNEVFEALTGSRAAFDPIDILKKLFGSDDDEDKPLDERIFEANKELFDNIPFGNLFTGGGRIPISEAFKGTSTFAKKMTGQKNQYGGDITWEDVGTDVLGSLPYYLLPTGYSQAKKTTKGLSMFSKDKEIKGSYTKSGRLRFPVKDTAANRIQAGLFGEYSSSEARKYFDQNRSALTENQQNMYKTLKMPISDYWEINKEINSIKKELNGKDISTNERKEKYFDYIDSLDVSSIKKSILKKSLYKSYHDEDYEIEEYINSSNMSKQSKKDILEKLGLD